MLAVAAVDFAVGVPSGLLGVGGPVLAIPILVTFGVPIVLVVAVAQVQSIFIVVPTAVGYLVTGAVSLPLVVLLGLPELAGILLGWKLAQRVRRIISNECSPGYWLFSARIWHSDRKPWTARRYHNRFQGA